MTEVNFHTGMADPLDHACRLVRKASRSGARVVVTGDADLLDRLDALLWTFEPLEFLPHLRVLPGTMPTARLADTPVWLASDPREAAHHDVLVNLGPDISPGFEGFRRLFELVGRDASQREAGRRRWQHFKTRGYPVLHQEIAG